MFKKMFNYKKYNKPITVYFQPTGYGERMFELNLINSLTKSEMRCVLTALLNRYPIDSPERDAVLECVLWKGEK